MSVNAGKTEAARRSRRGKGFQNRKGRDDSRPPSSILPKVGRPQLWLGLRDRLIDQLMALGLPPEKRVSFVAEVTGRAKQTVRRWFADGEQGLPDLESFVRLCAELGVGADELLGLDAGSGTVRAIQGPLREVARSVHEMACVLGRIGASCEPIRIAGDEMSPRLCEGDLAFVDESSDFAGNGLYALHSRGAVIIRRVEHRIDHGWLVKCDNEAYEDSELDAASINRKRSLRLIGKVRGTISLRMV